MKGSIISFLLQRFTGAICMKHVHYGFYLQYEENLSITKSYLFGFVSCLLFLLGVRWLWACWQCGVWLNVSDCCVMRLYFFLSDTPIHTRRGLLTDETNIKLAGNWLIHTSLMLCSQLSETKWPSHNQVILHYSW